MILPDLMHLHQSNGAVTHNGLISHYGAVSKEYRFLKNEVAWCDFSSFAKMSVRGDDKVSWFQGQTTNDVYSLSPASPLLTTILRPTGQLVADLSVFDHTDNWLIFVNATDLENLISRLESMIILEDVHLKNASNHFGLIRLIGPKNQSINVKGLANNDGLYVFPDPVMPGYFFWFSETGFQFLLPLIKELPPAGMDAYDIMRLEYGEPLAGRDFNDKTLIMEMGDAFISRRISFDKGCYTGQEIVQRIYARGQTHRSWVGLFTEDFISVGSKIMRDNKEVGFITSSARSPDNGPIATAMIRKEPLNTSDRIEVVDGNRTIRAAIVMLPFVGKERPADV